MDINGTSQQTAAVGDYLGWLVRRWWIVAIAMAVCAVGALGYVSTQPKAYDSTTPVLVLPPAGDSSKVDLDTEAQIVPQAAVATGAQTLLGTTRTLPDLISHISVTVPPNTAILDITCEAATPLDAQKCSQAFAQAYLDQRATVAQKALDQQIAAIVDKITALNKQLNTAAAQAATQSNGTAGKEQATQNMQSLNNQISAANNRLQPLQAIVINPGRILTPANLPKHVSKPNIKLYLISGIAVGVLLGLAGALIIARLDTRVYGGKDIPERPDVPVLMEIKPGRQRLGVADAATALGREFSLLRNILRFAAGSARGGRPSATDTLLVCGAVPGPAAGFVVANLAAAFARSGERVAIVCTDPDSNIPDILGVPRSHGLGEVLAGELELSAAIRVVPAMRDVTVLTAGQLDPRLELPVAAVSELLHFVQQGTDRVLIAASAPTVAVDAQALSEVAATVLLVVETRRSHVPEVEAALDQFARVYAPVAGMLVVVDQRRSNDSSPKRPAIPALASPASRAAVTAEEAADEPVAVPEAPQAKDAQTVVPPRQLRGWQNRTGDATMVLPKISDVEDPPTTEWPDTSTLNSLSLGESSGSEKR
jgi:succinoglycan biosynthesis transport protein ExoP